MKFFSRDLNEQAKAGTLPQIHSRGTILEQAITILNQDGKASLVFTGEPGVGKTSLVEGLAQCLVRGDVPEQLRGTRICELDLNALAAGTIYHGQFEENMKALTDWLVANPKTVVFIDELHSILSISADKERVSPLANHLKPFLARGQIRVIGATTNREYEAMNARDSALARRFIRVDVPEPSRDEAIEIVSPVAAERAGASGVSLASGVVPIAVDLSIKLVHDRRLPDKALDLLIGCIGKKATNEANHGIHEQSSIAALLQIVRDEVHAIDIEDWPTVVAKTSDWFKLRSKSHRIITPKDVEEFAAERYGGMDTSDEGTLNKILNLEANLRLDLIGQDRAIRLVSSALKRVTALGYSNRPIGSFLFVGPTGVGKTELCRAVSKQLWGGGNLLQYNMSEYMGREDASKLIGPPPGFVGYEEGGRLIRDVSQRPSGVILFDEIEKAHPDIHNLLLQILEEGNLRDGMGKMCSFSQSLVMMTSNVAAEWISSISPEHLEHNYEDVQRVLLEQLKQEFRPEILNRIDEIVIFTSLSRVDLERILSLQVKEENRSLRASQRPSLELTDSARTAVLERGYDPCFGARPLRRSLQHMVMSPFADYLLLHPSLRTNSTPCSLIADFRDGAIVISEKVGQAE